MTGFLQDIFGGAPYETYAGGLGEAERPIQRGVSRAVGYLSPYEKVGRSALNEYFAHLNQMGDPTGFYNQIMQHYQESPAVKFQQAQGLDALKSQAAATGMTGAGQEMKDIMRYSQGLTAQGQQQYLQNILGIGGQYLGGMRGLAGAGQQAALGMGGYQMAGAQDISSLMAQQARARAQAQAAQEAGIGGFLGNILGMPLGMGQPGQTGIIPSM